MDKFLLGDMLLCWDGGGYELAKGDFFEKFRVDASMTGEELFFQGVMEPFEQYCTYPKLTSHTIYDLYQVGKEHVIMYHWGRLKNSYAIWTDRISSDTVNMCYFNPEIVKEPPMKEDWFLGVAGLHKALLQKEAPVLHASYIDVDGQGVLFSAPSQTGKSTQAELWRRYAGAEIINGDRVLLRRRGNVWHAYGFPCCGSSGICVNRTVPVRAIVILEQGPENRVVPMSAAEKLRCLVSAIEVYRWDAVEVELAFHMAEQLIETVPVVRLICRPDEEAVRVLQENLKI